MIDFPFFLIYKNYLVFTISIIKKYYIFIIHIKQKSERKKIKKCKKCCKISENSQNYPLALFLNNKKLFLYKLVPLPITYSKIPKEPESNPKF